jgi:hypothetical protein
MKNRSLYIGDDYVEAEQYMKSIGFQQLPNETWERKIGVASKEVAEIGRGFGQVWYANIKKEYV